MRQAKKRQEVEEDDEDDDEEEEEEEDRKNFLGSPLSQSSPAAAFVRCPPPPPAPELSRPPPPTNGERRPRGRPPKNWPWGKVKEGGRVGRPPKNRPAEPTAADGRPEGGKPPGPVSGPPSLFSLNRAAESAAFHSLDLARHPSITPNRRGRPPRKKRGPKPRLAEALRDVLPPHPAVSRLAECPSIRKSCFSESSEEEDDDEEEDEDEERGACSPPVLTKPTMGLKCKVREPFPLVTKLKCHATCNNSLRPALCDVVIFL